MIKHRNVKMPMRESKEIVTVPPNDLIIKHGNKTILLKREMNFNEVAGNIGSFLGNFAARIPTIAMRSNFIIAAEELRMIDVIIEPDAMFLLFFSFLFLFFLLLPPLLSLHLLLHHRYLSRLTLSHTCHTSLPVYYPRSFFLSLFSSACASSPNYVTMYGFRLYKYIKYTNTNTNTYIHNTIQWK